MVVGILVLELRLPGCRSLKDKRHLLRGLIEKARHEFRVAIAEVGDQELWGNAVVSASLPASTSGHAEEVLQAVLRLFENHPEIDVASAQHSHWRPDVV